MSQTYNGNTKRPKSQDTQLEILKIYTFCQKIQQRVLVLGDSAAGVTYLSMRIHLKSYHIFPLRVVATLRNDSRKVAVVAKKSHS